MSVRFGLAGTAVLAVAAGDAMAAEGGSSHYLPGTAGDIAIAQSPAPGLQMGNTLWYQDGNVGAAVLQGAVNFDLDVDVALNPACSSPRMGRLFMSPDCVITD
jgi:hypothetical protein